MGLPKLLRSASARPTWLDCQNAWLHFRSVLTAKDLKFGFHTSALPRLPKTWCSASAFPLCLDCQRSEVPRPHFRSALTAKNLNFRFCTSALPLLPNMWSSAPALPLCLDWQRFEVPLSALVLPGLPRMWSSASAFHPCLDFQRFAVSLLQFCSVLTAKDLKIGFSTYTLPSLPNMGRSASTLPFCFDCKISVVSHFRSPSFPKMWMHFCSALTAKVLPPQFRCRFILCISTQFRAVLHEGLAIQRDEASLFASKKSKPSNSHLVKFKRFLHVSECNLASTRKNAEQYIQRHWRSMQMVIDNNYTLSVCCCVDIIISLNG